MIASDQPYRWAAHATHVQSGAASAQSPQGSDTAVTGETQVAFLSGGGVTQLRMVEFSVVADSGDALAGTATITRQSGNPQRFFNVSAIG